MKKSLGISESVGAVPGTRVQKVLDDATKTEYYKRIEAEALRRLENGEHRGKVDEFIDRSMKTWGEPGEYTREAIKIHFGENPGGMKLDHAANLGEFAREKEQLIVVRGTKPGAVDWHGNPEYAPKGLDAPKGTYADDTGRVRPNVDEDGNLTTRTGELTGYKVDAEANILDPDGELSGFSVDKDGYVLDKEGRRLYSDYDLLGVYERTPGSLQHTPSTVWRNYVEDLNKRLDPNGEHVQHFENDAFVIEENGKAVLGNTDIGDRFLVAFADGKIAVVDEATLKVIYANRGIEWPYD